MADIYTFQPFTTKILKSSSDPSRLPLPRSEHCVVCNDAYLFSFGGLYPQTIFVRHFLYQNRLNIL